MASKSTNYLLSAFFLLLCTSGLFAQEEADATANNFWSRIFLPSIDAGYQVPNTDLLSGSVRIGTSLEYRIRNNNDFFIRLNYDTYGAQYNLLNAETTNTIEGTVQFTDVLLGPGYRLGDNTFRLMFSAMPGIKRYEFPTAMIEGQNVIVSSESKVIFTTLFLTTLEYYVDQKSALTFSVYQNQVWDEVDFWSDGGSAVGFSVGFITSLL
ncbi:MAG: hypothetical protein HRT74_00955 [Flavobacteriales bacterium]|nr:hypothetical protein [Flavobacteriales bacterium]